ncbi:MAG: exodeoxyribonuclease VII small subunit [Clostridia bacterium]|jgi:exodeoxyribonuclease VII small subunit|nr:exodeoxyribonuclease VII small subunit [Clostridia bacterium]
MGSKGLPFEEAIKQLENVAAELEKGDLNLDESVAKFEEGMKLSKQCSKLLEDAEKRITILLKDGDSVKEENFIQEEE